MYTRCYCVITICYLSWHVRVIIDKMQNPRVYLVNTSTFHEDFHRIKPRSFRITNRRINCIINGTIPILKKERKNIPIRNAIAFIIETNRYLD